MATSHRYKVIISWSNGKTSDYYIDEYTLTFENGHIRCVMKCVDGTLRWTTIHEGSLTVIELPIEKGEKETKVG